MHQTVTGVEPVMNPPIPHCVCHVILAGWVRHVMTLAYMECKHQWIVVSVYAKKGGQVSDVIQNALSTVASAQSLECVIVHTNLVGKEESAISLAALVYTELTAVAEVFLDYNYIMNFKLTLSMLMDSFYDRLFSVDCRSECV